MACGYLRSDYQWVLLPHRQKARKCTNILKSCPGKTCDNTLINTGNICTSQNVNKICYRSIQLLMIFISYEKKECRLRLISFHTKIHDHLNTRLNINRCCLDFTFKIQDSSSKSRVPSSIRPVTGYSGLCITEISFYQCPENIFGE